MVQQKKFVFVSKKKDIFRMYFLFIVKTFSSSLKPEIPDQER